MKNENCSQGDYARTVADMGLTVVDDGELSRSYTLHIAEGVNPVLPVSDT